MLACSQLPSFSLMAKSALVSGTKKILRCHPKLPPGRTAADVGPGWWGGGLLLEGITQQIHVTCLFNSNSAKLGKHTLLCKSWAGVISEDKLRNKQWMSSIFHIHQTRKPDNKGTHLSCACFHFITVTESKNQLRSVIVFRSSNMISPPKFLISLNTDHGSRPSLWVQFAVAEFFHERPFLINSVFWLEVCTPIAS